MKLETIVTYQVENDDSVYSCSLPGHVSIIEIKEDLEKQNCIYISHRYTSKNY